MLLRLGVGEELVFPDSAVPCAGDALELVALERGMDVSLGHALGEGLVELIDIIAVVVVAVVLRAGPLAGKQEVGICYADAVRIGVELTDCVRIQGGRLTAAEENLAVHIAHNGIRIIFVDGFQLAAGLQDQTRRDLTAADGSHQLFQLRDLTNVGTLIDQAPHMDGQLAAVHIVCFIAQEVEKLGGMAKAIETGLPKMRIEEAAARRQARIDSGRENIVGLNYMQLEHEDAIDILEVDNTAVREAQIARLNKLRANRDNEKVQQCLDAITKSVETGEGNLLELAVEAARARASLGEISMAVEKVCGRHKAVIRSISGVYSKESSDTAAIERVRKMTDEFEKREGSRPRIMVAKMGQDGHDRGAKVVATAYADMGFDVDVGPLFQTPAETARDAVDNDVHIVGMSSLAAGHKTLLPQLMEELKKLGREDIMVIAGGVIPPQDYDFLYKAGAACIFGPGTRIPEAAEEMLNKLNERLGYTK